MSLVLSRHLTMSASRPSRCLHVMLLARPLFAWLPLACVLLPMLTSCSSPRSTRHPPAPAQSVSTAPAPAPSAGEYAPTPTEERLKGTPPAVPPTVPTRPSVDPAAAPVVERLAAQLLLAPEAIVVTSVMPAEWPDACLGLPAEGEICASMITPGYTVTVTVGIDAYEFRTDLSGEKIRVASAPPARTGEPLVTWRDARSFNMMIIGTQRVALGRRGRPLIAAPLAVPARATELQDLLARYAPFQVQTPAGEIALRGVGSARATETEQRMIAEWARLVSLEARVGGEQPEAQVALVYTSSGGAAGLSDQIEVTRTGEVTATSWNDGNATPIARIKLTPDDLMRLYAWLDRIEPFFQESKQTRTSGPASISLDFRGSGVDEATDQDHAALQAWIDTLGARLREAALR